ncbi:MAG: hypothetical protein AABX13_02600 [Nanoarchaeota archaeon]
MPMRFWIGWDKSEGTLDSGICFDFIMPLKLFHSTLETQLVSSSSFAIRPLAVMAR